jgi:hypothetical protein
MDGLKVIYRTPEGKVDDTLLWREDEKRIEFVEQSRPGIPWDRRPIERILAATGKEHVPPNLDKEKLADGLEHCLATYLAARDRSSDVPRNARLRRLRSICATAKKLKTQLAPADVLDWTRDWECEVLRKDLGGLIQKLECTISDLNQELRFGLDAEEALRLGMAPREWANRWKAYSPFEWTAGHYLPELFEEHFGGESTFRRRDADKVKGGPTIRFIEKALIELGILENGKPYSRGSVTRALTALRTRNSRKKHR